MTTRVADTLGVILAGGFGKRIRHVVRDVPKPLAPAAGRPFIEWVIRFLRKQGLSRVVISSGYLADKVQEFATHLSIDGMAVSCVPETTALGTAGGFLNALEQSHDNYTQVLVCNGDSLVLADLEPMALSLLDDSVDACLLAVPVTDGSRFGTLDVDKDCLLRGFREKHAGAALINGGVYLFRRSCVARFSAKRPLSFEYEVFPALLSSDIRIKVVSSAAPFLDIGTEESLLQADGFIKQHIQRFA